MPSFMESLRLMRAGAINQGVYTMGSMTMDGRHRVEAYIDRWHCRRVAHRYSKGLTLVLHHLAYRVRQVTTFPAGSLQNLLFFENFTQNSTLVR